MKIRNSFCFGGGLGALALALCVTPAQAQTSSGQTAADDSDGQAIIVTGLASALVV